MDGREYVVSIALITEPTAQNGLLPAAIEHGNLQVDTSGGTTSTTKSTPEIGSECFTSTKSAKRFAYRNLYGLSIGFMVSNSAFLGLQNLQSSINSSGGLGVISLAIVYGFYILGGFFTPGFVKIFGTKISLLISFSGVMLYTLFNYYSSWYTLIPGSIIVGICTGPIYTASAVHIAETSRRAGPKLGKDLGYLISKYTGVFFFFYQFAHLPGNLSSSLILFPYNKAADNASTVDGLDNTAFLEGQCIGINSSTFTDIHQYSLISVFLCFNIAGLLILLLSLDNLRTENKFFSTQRKFYLYFQKPFVRLLRVLKHRHMLLIGPMAATSGVELAFAFGTFTELFISDCFGLYLVGFTLILFGFSSAATSMAYSKVVKYMPLLVITLFAASLNIGVIIFLLIWERAPSYGVIFSFAIVWGMADAIWNTVPPSLTGILFSDQTEVAYSAMRIWQGLGFCVGFATAKLLPLEGRLGTLCGVVILAAVCHIVIHLISKSKRTLCFCCPTIKKTDQDDSTSGSLDAGPPQLNDRRDSLYNAPPPASAGMNTMFETYQERRPSAWSMQSYFDGEFDFSSQPGSRRPSAFQFADGGGLSPVPELEEDDRQFLDAQSFDDEDASHSSTGMKLQRSTSYLNAINTAAEETVL